MKSLRLLVIGQIKTSWFREAAVHYLTALRRHLPAEELVLRDGKAAQPQRRQVEEGQAVLARVGARDFLVACDEGGRSMASRDLAAWLRRLIEDPGRQPTFVVGGPHGLAPEVLARADAVLALGPGTLPHELARVVLYEQLYRAATILVGAPYHH